MTAPARRALGALVALAAAGMLAISCNGGEDGETTAMVAPSATATATATRVTTATATPMTTPPAIPAPTLVLTNLGIQVGNYRVRVEVYFPSGTIASRYIEIEVSRDEGPFNQWIRGWLSSPMAFIYRQPVNDSPSTIRFRGRGYDDSVGGSGFDYGDWGWGSRSTWTRPQVATPAPIVVPTFSKTPTPRSMPQERTPTPANAPEPTSTPMLSPTASRPPPPPMPVPTAEPEGAPVADPVSEVDNWYPKTPGYYIDASGQIVDTGSAFCGTIEDREKPRTIFVARLKSPDCLAPNGVIDGSIYSAGLGTGTVIDVEVTAPSGGFFSGEFRLYINGDNGRHRIHQMGAGWARHRQNILATFFPRGLFGRRLLIDGENTITVKADLISYYDLCNDWLEATNGLVACHRDDGMVFYTHEYKNFIDNYDKKVPYEFSITFRIDFDSLGWPKSMEYSDD